MRTGIEDAVASFELVTQHMAEAVEARTLEGRSAILSLRRGNVEAIETLHRAVTELLARLPAVVRYEIETEFEERFQAMRRTVSLHQGKWPAVLIAEDPQGFLNSARTARQTKADLLRWIRRELLPLV